MKKLNMVGFDINSIQKNLELALVVDKEIGRIVCASADPHQAVILSEGLINCGVQFMPVEKIIYDLNDINRNYQYLYGDKIILLSSDRILDDWTHLRTQALYRLNAVKFLDAKAKIRTLAVNNYYNTPIFTAILAAELTKCNSKENDYSAAIEEWATLQDIPVEIAYKELKIKYQDISMTYMRNNALYSKYIRKINQTSNWDDLQKIMDEITISYTTSSL